MELQLGLALPTQLNPTKGFDLIDNIGFKPKETMELGSCRNHQHTRKDVRRKRSFDQAFDDNIGDDESRMAALLIWSGQPNEEDDDQGNRKKRTSSAINKREEEEKPGVVGWPPIHSTRRKLLHGGQGGRMENIAAENYENGRSNSKFVKVKMEGVAIARKIDLRLYHSFHTLKHSLVTMFSKYQKLDRLRAVRYTLTYQDKEGDWLLAGDVPWQIFVESVQRMEIVRKMGE